MRTVFVSETLLATLMLVLIGLLAVNIVLQVSCCLLRGGVAAPAAGVNAVRQTVVLKGSGSTFIYPQMLAWIRAFHERYPWIVVDYSPAGSGTGLSQLLEDRVVDFACSDPPLSRSQYERYRGQVLQMPVVVGAVAVVYKVPGYSGPLNLSGRVLALIYRGDIRYWDDPRIAELNPGARLPHVEIKVIHRSDASGTTEVFTYFLHKAAPDLWPKSLVGKAIEWPVDRTGRGLGAKGNQGVSEYFKTLDSAIAYVELSYALENNFSVAAIENAEGVFVKPTTETVQAAVANAVRSGLLPSSPLDDWSGALDAIVYAPGRDSYPIVTFTFMVLWTRYPEPKLDAIKRFVEFVNTAGQEMIVRGYAPIPEELRRVNLRALELLGEG